MSWFPRRLDRDGLPRNKRRGLGLRRRDFIAGLGGAITALPIAWLATRAQQNDQVRALQLRVLRLLAERVAIIIRGFIGGIESQVGWTTQLPLSPRCPSPLGPGFTNWVNFPTCDQRRSDARRLLRQVPAIREFAQLDGAGMEQLRSTRGAMDEVATNRDYSQDPKFTVAMEKKVYYGPVYWWREVNPYMTMSLAGTRRDAGVSVVEVSLKLIGDLATITKVGDHGTAYVVDAQGRVIAHPDSNLVQRDFSSLQHVQAARAAGFGPPAVQVTRDINGREVLATYEPVAGPNWLVFVELPVEEANVRAQ